MSRFVPLLTLLLLLAPLAWAADQGYRCVISLTNNPRLARLYEDLAFREAGPHDYPSRQLKSPGVRMYIRSVA